MFMLNAVHFMVHCSLFDTVCDIEVDQFTSKPLNANQKIRFIAKFGFGVVICFVSHFLRAAKSIISKLKI